MPDWKQEIRAQLKSLNIEPTREAEIVEELSLHLEDRYRELVSRGAPEPEARRAVLEELSENRTLQRELQRVEVEATPDLVSGGATGRNLTADLFRDLGYGIRMLCRNPGFTMIAVLMLGVGIGANTAIFSAINTLMLRPLPVEEIDRVVFGCALREGYDPFWTSPLEFVAYQERSRSFAEMGVGVQQFFHLLGYNEPQRLQGAAVMADYLATLGIKPVLGRCFTREEDEPGGPALALLGHGIWQRSFGADPEIVGRSLNLDGHSYTVIGVMPAGFDLPYAAELWVPLQLDFRSLPLEQRTRNNTEMVARLKPNVSVEQADQELKEIARQLEQEFPQFRLGWSYQLIPLRQLLIGDLAGRTRKALFVLLAAVGFLLLICSANVASLLLARGVAREREVAIRLSLGASRGRVLRQLLTESLLLAALGGILGLLLAYWLIPVLGSLSPIRAVSFSAFLSDLRIDSRVLMFTMLISVLTGAIFGAVPALRTVRAGQLMSLIRQGEQRSGGSSKGRRWLRVLVVGEIAVAVTLLAGAALMVQSFHRLQNVELGFRTERLLAGRMVLSPNKYLDHERRVALVEQVLGRIKTLPGVVSVGATTNIPLSLVTFDSPFTVEGRPPAQSSEVLYTAHRLVSPGYLETLGVTLVKGRLINEQDRPGGLPVVVISEELARQGWPGEDPIGKRVRAGRLDQTDRPWLTVVGVVKDVKEDRFYFRINRPVWYLPYFEYGNYPFVAPAITMQVNVLVKASGDPIGLASAIRSSVRSIDQDQPISELTTMPAELADVLVTERFSAVLIGALAALGLGLAALGLYGVMSYSVSQRTAEIGLRMALGALPRDVFKLVFGQGVLLIAIGLSLGLAGALAVSRLLSDTLYGVSPTDPGNFIIISVVLATVALLACFLPARRATKVDPMVALRWE